ncbi:MAG: hypothetical protein Q8N53_24895 [Longimicrobiales bacterium]|nr:hypothetical protein [Longimicrobiales bacterium]
MTVELLPGVHARFDSICRALAARGRGSTMADLGSAFALATELEGPEPDMAVVVGLYARMGLTPGASLLVRDAEEQGACR